MCLYQRQYVLTPEATSRDPRDQTAVRQLLRQRMRLVHVGHTQATVRSMRLFRNVNTSTDPESLLKPRLAKCALLVWLPVWGYNIGTAPQSPTATRPQ